MQKKSLLVALFCGALCLTGCIKNEESASVAQVRIAKANELNSIADLNKAKAAAEAVYAQAELVVAQAEAKLREANANLVNAQAETEKVRAELLKVRVALAEVEVDEEKVRLQMLEADLEQKLAEVEAAVAAAKAQKQEFINQLEHLLAESQVQAINDAQSILEAQDQLQEYLLTQEGEKAENAEAASEKYFDALEQIQALQFQQITIRAEKALVEAGALEIRDAIHYAIDQIDEEIAKKEALVEYLKEYQTMTPEEAEEALKAARTALNEAYNEYKAAVEVRGAAEEAQNELWAKTSDFFAGNWQGVMNAVTSVPGINIKPDYVDVKVGNGIVSAFAGGVNKVTEDGIDFLPLFSDEAYDYEFVRYPDIDVYTIDAEGKYPIIPSDQKTNDFVTLQTTLIAPATIYYDNIQEAMDTVVARQQRFADGNFAFVEWLNNLQAENLEKEIATLTEYNKLQQKYVDARKDTVEKYENAFIAEIGKWEDYQAEKTSTWKAFEEYMLLKTDVSRKYFVNRFMADTAYRKAYKDSTEADLRLATAKAGIPTLEKSVITTFETTFAEAEGAYNLSQARCSTSTYATLQEELNKAKGRWDPDFDEAIKGEVPAKPYGEPGSYKGIAQYGVNTQWYTAEPSTAAGSTQDSTQTWLANIELAKDASYKAGINMVRYPEGTTQHEGYAKTKHVADSLVEALTKQLNTKVTGVRATEDAAADLYANRVEELDTYVYGEGNNKKKIWAAYNPEFNNNSIFTLCSFPTEATQTEVPFDIKENKVSKDKKGWYIGTGDNKKYAGTAQAELLDKVAAVEAANKDVKVPEIYVEEIDKDSTTGQVFSYYDNKFKNAKAALETATKKLVVALDGGDPETADLTKVDLSKIDLKDYIDDKADDLYQAFLDVENESKYFEALAALWKVYGKFNPDQVGKWETHPGFDKYEFEDAQFGWLRSSYNVDYEATYVNLQGEREPIAWILYPWDEEQFTYSYAYMIEDAQNEIDVEIPERIAGSKTWWDNYMKDVKSKVSTAIAAVNSYKAHEAGYKALVADRENAEVAVNEALKAEFDAEQVLTVVRAAYEALEAVANEGMWVYDPDEKIFEKVYPYEDPKESEYRSDDFTWITINEEIARLEGTTDVLHEILGNLIVASITEGEIPDFDEIDLDDLGISPESIAGLSFAKKLLEETLIQGKIGLQVVLDSFDAELDVIDEKIDLYTKLAATYKAIMNAWLGIVEETVVEPVDGEGDEE